jgi:hypothetical protein
MPNNKTALWQDVNNRRKFFEDYARVRGFDPLQPDRWYFSTDDILATKVCSCSLVIFLN